MYARRGSKTMMHEAECCKDNLRKVSDNGVPNVLMLFFISKQQAEVEMPDNPENYLQVYRDYTYNKQEYIDIDCGHYLHVEEPDFVADKIKEFISGLDND